jgi:alpha-N-arabinofuranosidase
MPVTWEDGWPVFGQQGRLLDPVALNEIAPLRQALIDDFASPERPLFWNTRMGWGRDTMQRAGGRLVLTPNGNTLEMDGAMAWVGFRQPDFTAHLAITLDLDSLRPGQRAGITAYLDPLHHYALEVRRTETGCVAASRLRLGSTQAVLAERAIAASAVALVVEAETGDDTRLAEGRYRFSIQAEGQGRQSLGSADMRLLGVAIANSYTGVYLGVFAEGPRSPVAFSRFTGGAGAM